ncbi:MAG TPA: HTH domain-containing protein [Solirubrobacterales bacterium]|jgi:predicted ArsR family transcriptional regulator|nr:HTH domain-containing protein [Solirubrobacterales bacterium]
MRVSRLLTLVGLLKARGSMTADELAGELGVSRRTVYRDVEVLAKAGVRLESAHGPAGGYRIPRRGRPEMLGLGAEATESAALARALGSGDRRFAALAAPAVSAAARAVREERWVAIVRDDGERLEAEALGLVHDGEGWQLLCRAGDEVQAESLDEAVSVDPLPRRHPGEIAFDAMAEWESLRSRATLLMGRKPLI